MGHAAFAVSAPQLVSWIYKSGFITFEGAADPSVPALPILAALVGSRTAPKAVPWLVGLVIVAAYWFTSSTSFANPAVTLARGRADHDLCQHRHLGRAGIRGR